jgi:hypothetical protein
VKDAGATDHERRGPAATLAIDTRAAVVKMWVRVNMKPMKQYLACLALLGSLLTSCSERDSKGLETYTVAPVQIAGNYKYLGNGMATVQQNGNNVHILMTWTPQGVGPHYEIKGTISGNLIEGERYSHVAKKGCYHFKGEVSDSGRTINFAKTEDPLDVSMNKLMLHRD